MQWRGAGGRRASRDKDGDSEARAPWAEWLIFRVDKSYPGETLPATGAAPVGGRKRLTTAPRLGRAGATRSPISIPAARDGRSAVGTRIFTKPIYVHLQRGAYRAELGRLLGEAAVFWETSLAAPLA